MQRTFVMIKPDGVERRLSGIVINKLELKGLRLQGIKILIPTEKMAMEHYAEHVGKPFYDGLIKHLTSGPVIAMVWEGSDAIKVVRSIVGKTNPIDASPGTIRGDFGLDMGKNIVHASDSIESAERELGIYFKDNELIHHIYNDKTYFE
ncbi:MAG: nucleoside-diphosphate kinase [Candidatus Thermoplasmatota archaeon]|nr:nucleoside-diphosphate kinase [Candidatus Thermoplasmatota archaeon]MCL5963098.1 nucleoside-diphosphate kinase [Candidatus Thermoplasmatota archaeon]